MGNLAMTNKSRFNKRQIRYLLFPLVSFSLTAAAQQPDSTVQSKQTVYPGWTLWIPGATQLYDDRTIEGLLFSGVEIGGLTLGIAYADKLKSQSSTPYYNFPLLIGLEAYNVDKCDWLRARLEYIKYKRPGFNYDTIQFNDLLLSPFKLKNIFTPITGGFILAALAELYFEGRNASQTINDVNKMYFMNRFIDKNPALSMYGSLSLALSWGAGISEEYLFRNGIMPLWDYEYGQTKGLVYSSLFFGSLHFSNVLFSNNPDYKAALLQVAETTIAGYFLGRDVQNRGYSIGPAAAAHTWYDFILMAGSFLVDPKDNAFGVNVKFVIN
jgi:membrane protease YdiL (CAAX protease family)